MTEIVIKTFDGRSFSLNIESNDTVENLKLKIQDNIHLPPDEQFLVHSGKVMREMGKTMSELDIRSEAVIHVLRKSGHI